MASGDLHNPFNQNKKVYTDVESITLFMRLMNVWAAPKMEYVYRGDWEPPSGVENRNPNRLPMVAMAVVDEHFHETVKRLERDERVVAIFYHPALNRGVPPGGRMIYALMMSERDAEQFVGM